MPELAEISLWLQNSPLASLIFIAFVVYFIFWFIGLIFGLIGRLFYFASLLFLLFVGSVWLSDTLFAFQNARSIFLIGVGLFLLPMIGRFLGWLKRGILSIRARGETSATDRSDK